MKKFLYTRLKESDYGFHVEPTKTLSRKMHEIATETVTRGEGKRLILFSDGGDVILGVQEKLSLKDSFGRTIDNLVGFRIEPGEPIPFFDELNSKLAAIHSEVILAHAKLNERPLSGKTLQNTDIIFDKGTYTAGNAWDEAVRAIEKDRETPRLFVGDVHGHGRQLPPEPMAMPFAPEIQENKSEASNLPESEKAARAEPVAEEIKKKPFESYLPAEKPAAWWSDERLTPTGMSTSRFAIRCLTAGGVLMAVAGGYLANASVHKDPNTGETKRNWVSTVLGAAGAAAGAGLAVWGLRR